MAQTGFCKFGSNCKYAHGEQELRDPHDPINNNSQNQIANLAYLNAFVNQPPPKATEAVIKKLSNDT